MGEIIYGRDDDTLEEIVGSLLRDQGLSISVAESCTGGLLLNHLTNVPGSSGYVLGGVIAYSNQVKQHQLGVSSKSLEDFGAVSEVVAIQMAEGVRIRLGSDVGLSVTGIAGPTGGTAEKPVGLVWIGYADGNQAWATEHRFVQHRDRNKQKSVLAALDMVRRELLKRNTSPVSNKQ